MKRFISAMATFIAVMLLSAMIVPLAACDPDDDCKIRVTSMGGLGLANVLVTVGQDGSLVANGTTDEEGNYTVNLSNGTYSVTLDNLPKGYNASDNYAIKITDDKKEFTLGVSSSIITEENLPQNKFFLTGDVMYDFTIANTYKAVMKTGEYGDTITVEKESLSLAEAFEGKKAVLLNFWYVGCSPCRQELPAIKQAYGEYASDLSVIAINNYPTDTDESVQEYTRTNEVTYPMGKDSAGVGSNFNLTAYPTSVMIDRYGVVCEFHVGSVDNTDFWRNWFKKYTAEDYSQDINPGGDIGSSTVEADKPADFGVEFTKNPEEISKLINSTGTSVTFTADESEYSWPWKIEGDSIVPTNSGHAKTPAIIYAALNMPESAVLAFDYTINCKDEEDYFYVAVDGRAGIGTQTIMDSGDKSWRTGYAYISLEAGMHEIAFTYFHTSSNKPDDKSRVNVKNLRFITIEEMLAEDVELDIPYYAARSLDPSTGKYEYYSEVEYDGSDGFYHVKGHRGADGKDPILLADIHHATPYFSQANASIFNNYISTSNCTFGGKDYLKELDSYSTWASNSEISGLVPVTEELKTILDALYKSENPPTAPQYSANGWLEFCAFYKHYGTGKSIDNPIKGLAWFSAIAAKETTDEPDNGNLNVANFNRLIMPRGLLFKFTPERSGVYKFSGASEAGSDAWLYNDGMELSTKYYQHINYCGDDYFVRNMPEGYDFDNVSFTMYNYLEAGKSYYLLVAFHDVDWLGELKFRIDYTGQSRVEYLTTVTAGFLYPSGNNVYRIPVYTEIELNVSDGFYYSKTTDKPIYCEFIDNSRMFNKYSVGVLLGKQGNVKFEKKPFDFTDFTMVSEGHTIGGKDYTSVMEKYYELSVRGKQQTDELYGLTEVTEELREVLTLFYAANAGFDDPNEWLTACWYYDYTAADKISPDTVLWTK